MLDGARYADANGFSGVWTPERHFHAFGGLYPNPSVTGAALSTITENVRIRSGSVVLPLHHPIRVAEEWSVVDNLSGGRAEISVASGWQPNDFVLRPEAFEDRKRHTSEGIATLRTLWSGGTYTARDGSGKEVEVSTLPRPVQSQIPIWYTAGGNPETFAEAGRLGANVLTHLLGQTFEEVAEKIAIYRRARQQAGFDPETGKVALMLHTFLGEDLESIRGITQVPFKNYLRSAFGLVTKLIETMDLPLDVKTMTEADRETLLEFAYERYFNTAALFGTVDSVQPLLGQIRDMGVDEVACLIDFGIETGEVLASLPRLKEAMDRAQRAGRAAAHSFEVQARRHRPTLLQCTPSTLRGLFHHRGTVDASSSLRKVLLGGEALPVDLARRVHEALPAELVNMYGPTETAIWSATWPVTETEGTVPIGRPIA
ncbi:MAG: MupA/Atu3671 family FMN-dependent luciferase-like monooxygenase, partial [Acidobacteriota bacterium]